MTTLTPAETLEMMFHMVVAAASGQGAKLSVMEQVGALSGAEYHDQVI
jgi:hypothetical protein